MRPILQLKLGQQLTMTPQLQQAIRLLQLSSLDLELEIRNVLETNLLLEQVEPDEENISTELTTEEHSEIHDSEYSMERLYLAHHELKSKNQNIDILSQKIPEVTLKQHLLWQMELAHLTHHEQEIALALIDSITEEGYLLCPLTDIQESFKTKPNISEIETVLYKIQQFDPCGVGARNLAECLTLQLNAKPKTLNYLTEAKILVLHYLEALGKKQYEFLKEKLNLDNSALKETIKILKSLNPRPGTQVFSKKSEYTLPDLIVTKKGQCISVNLNKAALPNIRLNSNYLSFIQASKYNDPTLQPFREHLKEAKLFLKGLETRHETLLKVAQCIIEQQKEFLEYGAIAMKPLNLQDVANMLGLHESTISRITSQKQILTPKGLFELKYFFSNSINSSIGQNTSTTSIRSFIQKIIAGESSQAPLSDHKIREILKEQGIPMARRTVTKYREALRIPSSSARKNLSFNLK